MNHFVPTFTTIPLMICVVATETLVTGPALHPSVFCAVPKRVWSFEGSPIVPASPKRDADGHPHTEPEIFSDYLGLDFSVDPPPSGDAVRLPEGVYELDPVKLSRGGGLSQQKTRRSRRTTPSCRWGTAVTRGALPTHLMSTFFRSAGKGLRPTARSSCRKG